jgi:hypothetical protein
MDEPKGELARYAFGYSDRKPSVTWWVIQIIIIAVALYGCIAVAMAQVPMPRTVPLTNANGEQVGTATFSGARIYLRDNKGELFAQIVVERDGTRTLYDSSGKQLDQIKGDIVVPTPPAEQNELPYWQRAK